MFWDLVATVFAGLGAAGIAYGIRGLTLKKAPKWIIPVFAGLGMMGYQIYIEYTWFGHMQSRLPAETEVVSTVEDKVFWRPWSYFAPQITRFTVLDKSSILRDVAGEDVVQFVLYRFKSSYGDRVAEKAYLLNCQSRELVPVSEAGEPEVTGMKTLPSGNKLLEAACR
ncbi:MAG: hypothetical protein WD623_07260 [Marinobacter sp.]|uniref:hypothetical protein n=1 Tax=Marinobacter sp. TaxID=50741 RepID=UPI0034A0227B